MYDDKGVRRIAVDPPDAKTDYTHIHLNDENGNSLDKDFKITNRKSKDAHIKFGNDDDFPPTGAVGGSASGSFSSSMNDITNRMSEITGLTGTALFIYIIISDVQGYILLEILSQYHKERTLSETILIAKRSPLWITLKH